MITMVDAPCGAGKTEWAISHMNAHPQESFIFVTPYLDEIERIKRGTKMAFYAPQNFQRVDLLGGDSGAKTKLEDFNDLLAAGRNIVTTHATFCNATQETVKIIRDNGYNLILDETVDVLVPLNDIVSSPDNRVNKRDAELMSANGLIEVGNDCRVCWTGGNLPIDGKERHKFCEIQRHSDNGTLLLIDGKFFIWEFPPEVFEAMESVTVLTYMPEGSYMGAYLRLHNLEYSKMSVIGEYGKGFELVPYQVDLKQRKEWKQLITLYSDKKPTDYGPLSVTWYRREVEGRKKSEEACKLRKGLRRYFETVNAKANDVMWCCPKDCRDTIAPRGYKITRELSDEEKCGKSQARLEEYIDEEGLRCWVSSSARATNQFSNRHVLAYMLKLSPNPEIAKYFGKQGASFSVDTFALSGLIQWVWRSAIRKGEPITLYLPSPKMLQLFAEWLNGER